MSTVAVLYNGVMTVMNDVTVATGVHEVDNAVEVVLVVEVATTPEVTLSIAVVNLTSSFVLTLCCPAEVTLVGAAATRSPIRVTFRP